MSTKILITDGMSPTAVDALKQEEGFEVDLRKETPVAELEKIIGNYQAIVIRSATTLTKELLSLASQMKLIVRAGAGVDNIDVAFATEKKIPVMNTASANSNAAAEQTIALLFAMFRQIPQAYTSMKEKRWDRALFKGYEVSGKTLGVVGLGNIGRLVAEKAHGLGMKVIAFDPVIKTSPEGYIQLYSDLNEVLTRCDVLTLHVPKNDKTKNLINSDTLSLMKDGSFLVNCARGGVVDETAVLKALDSKKLKAASFDVFEKEPVDFPHALSQHPSVICVPHLGASTVEAQERVGQTAVQQMIGFFKNGDHTGVVNRI